MIERAPSLVVGQRVRLATADGWSEFAARLLNGKLATVAEVRVPEPGTGLALLGVGYRVRLDEAVTADAFGKLTELWMARAFLEPVTEAGQ